MTWQEELQKLDLELASGRISADDYRRRRDEVLAASSGAAPQPQPQQQPGPFAPPFKWDATPPQPQQQPNPDATQVVGNQPPQPQNPDATQVVSSGGQQPDADRTQYVRPVSGPVSGPIPQQQPPMQGGWQSTPPQSAPPWGDAGFSPMAEPTPAWIAQGPEVFDEKGGGKGKIFAIIGVVLVLALIGGGIWWFASKKSDSTNVAESSSQAPSTTTTTKKPKDDLEIADMPGGAKKDPSNVKAWSDVVSNNLLAPEENAAYEAGEPGKARIASAKLPDDATVQIITVQLSSPEAAKKAVEDLQAAQTKFGLQAYGGTCPTGIVCQTLAPTDKPGNVRAHYVHKNTVARVQVVAKDQAALNKIFEEVIAAQMEALSVDA